MLVLTRTLDSVVRVGDAISVLVRDLRCGEAKLQVDYPWPLAIRGPAGLVNGQMLPAPDGQPDLMASRRYRAEVWLKQEEAVAIGDEIVVQVVDLTDKVPSPRRIRLGFQAPPEIRIERDEYKGTPPSQTTA